MNSPPENMRRIGLLLILAIGIGTALVYREHISVAALEQWLGQLGWAAPLVFIACYAIATVFFMPGLLFTLAGGALFGPVFGTLYNLAGATLGAMLAFLAARYIASDWATRRAGKRLRQLVEGVENEGWRFVAFVRLVPLFPFNVLNYALGLTRIRLLTYVVTSFVFMAPGGAAYTYLGYAGRELVAGGEDIVKKALLAIAVVATVAFGSRIIMRLRRNRTG
ncbi:MAG: TVP38/TMEM64 family protein [Gammaproteobacteria bacterium]